MTAFTDRPLPAVPAVRQIPGPSAGGRSVGVLLHGRAGVLALLSVLEDRPMSAGPVVALGHRAPRIALADVCTPPPVAPGLSPRFVVLAGTCRHPDREESNGTWRCAKPECRAVLGYLGSEVCSPGSRPAAPDPCPGHPTVTRKRGKS